MNEEKTMVEAAVAEKEKKNEEEDRKEEELLTGWPQRTWSKPNLPVLPLATTTTYRTITCNQSISGLQLHLYLFYPMYRVCQNSGIPCVLTASSTDVAVTVAKKRFFPWKSFIINFLCYWFTHVERISFQFFTLLCIYDMLYKLI